MASKDMLQKKLQAKIIGIGIERKVEEVEIKKEKLLSICAYCKRVKVDNDQWLQVEEFIKRCCADTVAVGVEFSYGACPACSVRLLADLELKEH